MREVHLSTKSKTWNPLICVIVHQNSWNCQDCILVLVWARWIHVMKWVRTGWSPIWACEIDSYDHVQLKTAFEVVDEWRSANERKIFQNKQPWIFLFGIYQRKLDRSVTTLDLIHVSSYWSNKIVFSVFLPIPAFDSKITIFLITKLLNLDIDRIPWWI